jgi:Domain of unknown function (DUF4450)
MKLSIKNKNYYCCALFMLCFCLAARSQKLTKYSAENNAVTGFNGSLYNNRPLYCNNSDAFVLTGDKPLIRFAKTPYVYGAFMAGVLRNGKVKWLVDCSSIKMEYGGNITTWVVTDSSINFPVIKLSAVPMAGTTGLAINAQIIKADAGDKLVWVYGGAQYKNEGWLSWNFDISGNEKMGSWGFEPEDANGNTVTVTNGKFLIGPLIDTAKLKGGPYGIVTLNPDTAVIVEGICSDTAEMQVTGAQNIYNWQRNKNSLLNAIVSGAIDISKSGKNIYWCIKPFSTQKNNTLTTTAQQAWHDGLKRTAQLANRIIVKTPDEKLNALVAVSSSVIDGVWYDSVYLHGAMLWNIPFPGWRTIFGGTMYGWHNRVMKEAQYYIASQNKDSSKKYAKADTALLSTLQHASSRFYGAGHINRDQYIYNFQTQFFDQLITEWRSTADTVLENILQPALNLHLKWEEECFDPDGDGVYESYINTWPTDCQWYNGGGTAEETAYAYKAHAAAADMAIRKNDRESAAYHKKKLAQIKNGFFKKLWIVKKGYAGAYREQGGYNRLHEDPWLYSIFLPIDTKLVNDEQAVSSLYYTKWALQNDTMPAGGRRVWTSNWVPGIPTVRELANGDNYHLALAYFLAGMADEGYDIMKGTFYEGAFNRLVPGDLGVNNGGTDFTDCASMFTRVLVEGLFGYRPDYPNKKVTVAPQFPKQWNDAAIKTPDVSIAFNTTKNIINAAISLNKKAFIDFYLPLQITGIKKVLVNNLPVKWELLPGYGQSQLHLQLNEITEAKILIETAGLTAMHQPVTLKKNKGDTLVLKLFNAKITGINNEQKVFSKLKIVNGALYATVSAEKGNYAITTDVLVGNLGQKRIIYLKVTDKIAAEKEQSKIVTAIPSNPTWSLINMQQILNADVTTIFKQQYLSPRPNTVSVRVGTDGYSPWTFLFWKYGVPPITLDSVKYLLKDSNQLLTRQQVPFYWNNDKKNIAFTSLWHNWPAKIVVPVNQKGKAVWLMIAGSTNPMQCNIANAEIIFTYTDKSRDTLSLTPPLNFWSLTPYNIKSPSPGVVSRGDYTNETDLFAVPKPWPQIIQLGENCRAVLLSRKLKEGIALKDITLQTLSQEVVIGLMGVTLMK